MKFIIEKTLLTALFLAAFFEKSTGQWMPDNPIRQFFVTNPGGANYFKNVSTAGWAEAGWLAFGQKLELDSLQKPIADTLACPGSPCDLMPFGPGFSAEKLPGYWLPIGQGRWVWDGFLTPEQLWGDAPPIEFMPKERDSFVLLRPGLECGFQFKYDHKWHWYGLFLKENRGWRLAPIDWISFFNIEGAHPCVSFYETEAVADGQKVSWIIGAKNELPTGALLGQSFLEHENESLENLPWTKLEFEKKDPANVLQITAIGKNGLRQALLPERTEGTYGAVKYAFYTLNWFGDLDGDSQPDYIVHFYSNGGDQLYRLFLSSAANAGEVAHAVAELIYYEIP